MKIKIPKLAIVAVFFILGVYIFSCDDCVRCMREESCAERKMKDEYIQNSPSKFTGTLKTILQEEEEEEECFEKEKKTLIIDNYGNRLGRISLDRVVKYQMCKMKRNDEK